MKGGLMNQSLSFIFLAWWWNAELVPKVTEEQREKNSTKDNKYLRTKYVVKYS